MQFNARRNEFATQRIVRREEVVTEVPYIRHVQVPVMVPDFQVMQKTVPIPVPKYRESITAVPEYYNMTKRLQMHASESLQIPMPVPQFVQRTSYMNVPVPVHIPRTREVYGSPEVLDRTYEKIVPYFTEKILDVTTDVPVEQIQLVKRVVEVPYEVKSQQVVENYTPKEYPVYRLTEVQEDVPVPMYHEQIVRRVEERQIPDPEEFDIIRQIPVPVYKERRVEVRVPVPVERIVYKDKRVEVPKVKYVPVPVPVARRKEVQVDVEQEVETEEVVITPYGTLTLSQWKEMMKGVGYQEE